MQRLLYALRYMAWLCVWKQDGPDKPFAYYLHRYDRRQEIFKECTHERNTEC